ncbi:ATP-binding cassette domain-containing protein [Devosia sp. J2-20]|jgi:branched-chain amino acid transport system ATP-binding protein|uniref:ABC transporter ATP-binding protein n=1 Tax=Devosia TaxID=46913 RepID=UPI0022AEF667|nr:MULTISPECIES: ATP-binding cassette domain-containing protein [Devosia]MCZ4346253.1 ATP-binding cassette domain-containing protein [Devosia neptuniae]WDQ98148.1 ATP-binding cassette domain-containing protein [Devosia sp. J2-20]|tara:strand:- start:4409 stop:5137 length:729 start_codon:yes stop_codon:yes gene_type:complete
MSALVRVEKLRKQFGGLTAVNNVDFSVAEGEIVALLGPNGSGKTTVINMISGAFAPTAGRIMFDETDISGLPPHRIAHHGVARTFQLVRVLPSLSVRQNIVAAVAFRRDAVWGEEAEIEAEKLLVDVGLAGRGHEMAQDLTYIDQKRMELARALAARPRLLLLDEWLSGLNPTELRVGIDLIVSLRERGMTVLLVEHIMEAVRALCSRAVVMNVGTKIADGPTNDVLADEHVVRAYLGEGHA